MSPPASIFHYSSNRTEVLAEALSDVVTTPLADPMMPELVVVQGRGMAVWLGMELSRRQGVWANADFAYPRRFVARAFEAVLGPDAVTTEPVTREQLLWSVLSTLPGLLGHEAFSRLSRYVSDDPLGARRFQLSQRIAHTFDQYLTYRPEMIRDWEAGRDGPLARTDHAWQPILWRRLRERLKAPHPAALERDFLERAASLDRLETMPERISVFGLTSLPPLYVRVLAALARLVDVHLFLLSPCEQFWEDLVAPAEKRRALRERSEHELHLDDGNPLLASLGVQGRDFRRVLSAELEQAGVPAVEPRDALFREPEARTMLARVQGDILHLRGAAPGPVAGDRPRAPAKAKRPRSRVPAGQLSLDFGAVAPQAPEREQPSKRECLDPDDATITLHSCHSRMREVEVLHDQLLDLLAHDKGIAPRDVIVMTPSIDDYAPLIEAVFERDRADPRFIPYRIADRSIRRESAVIDAFQRMLALVGGRAAASDLLDLLSLEAIGRKFGIEPADVETITDWVVQTGIRWGIDERHRERHDQPPERQNTWRFGLDRLLLGYAMPGSGRTTYEGVLPYDEIEGQTAQLAGRVAEFSSRLFEHLRALREPRTIPGWRDALGRVLDTLLAHDTETAWQHQRIREALAELVEQAAGAGFDEPVDIVIVRSLLDGVIDESHPARGFLAGGVTFCAMVPMRSIPFKVVCLLGMGDADFPRASRPVDFDLVANGPGGRRPGDRSRRDDDRYLFLEALLAARERVLITYPGQSIKDNAKKPPSVVVSELLDYLSEIYDPPGDETWNSDQERVDLVQGRLVLRHPLQAFSPRYFDPRDEPRLFSYAEAYLHGAESLGPEKKNAVALFDARLPEPPRDETERDAITLRELVRFYEGPVRYLLNRRLGVYLSDGVFDVPDREPIDLSPLERYGLGDRLLDLRLGGVSDGDALEILRAEGSLPLGAPGQSELVRALSTVGPLVQRVEQYRHGGALAPLTINRELPNGVRVTGEVDGRFSGYLLRHQFSRVRGKHVLAMWVKHLALSWATEGDATASALVGRGEGAELSIYEWRPVDPDRAARELVCLTEYYELGRREPLMLFPRSALAFATRFQRTGDVQRALSAADWEFQGNGNDNERAFDMHLQRVFDVGYLPSGPSPFDDPSLESPPFSELAAKVFTPLLEHLEEA